MVVKGKITAMSGTAKYVVKAKAGHLLTVSAGADKWTGKDGPVLVVAVGLPDGGGQGEPGGVSGVPTQDGDHEITVHQNRAKSRAENIEFTLTVTLASKGT